MFKINLYFQIEFGETFVFWEFSLWLSEIFSQSVIWFLICLWYNLFLSSVLELLFHFTVFAFWIIIRKPLKPTSKRQGTSPNVFFWRFQSFSYIWDFFNKCSVYRDVHMEVWMSSVFSQHPLLNCLLCSSDTRCPLHHKLNFLTYFGLFRDVFCPFGTMFLIYRQLESLPLYSNIISVPQINLWPFNVPCYCQQLSLSWGSYRCSFRSSHI